MTVILLCTVLGFLAGFSYVLIRRRVRVRAVLGASFLALLVAGIRRLIRQYGRRGRWYF